DLLHGGREDGLPAGELLGGIVLRERDRDLALIPRARAGELLLEPGHEPARAELEQVAAALAALERLAVDAPDVVDHHEVAVLGGALHGVERGERVAQALDLGLHVLLGNLDLAAADLEVLVVAELRLRADA